MSHSRQLLRGQPLSKRHLEDDVSSRNVITHVLLPAILITVAALVLVCALLVFLVDWMDRRRRKGSTKARDIVKNETSSTTSDDASREGLEGQATQEPFGTGGAPHPRSSRKHGLVVTPSDALPLSRVSSMTNSLADIEEETGGEWSKSQQRDPVEAEDRPSSSAIPPESRDVAESGIRVPVAERRDGSVAELSRQLQLVIGSIPGEDNVGLDPTLAQANGKSNALDPLPAADVDECIREICYVPVPGTKVSSASLLGLDVINALSPDTFPVIVAVAPSSPFKGRIFAGDVLVRLNKVALDGYRAVEVSQLLQQCRGALALTVESCRCDGASMSTIGSTLDVGLSATAVEV